MVEIETLEKLADEIINGQQIDAWDGKCIQVWLDNNDIYNLKPKNNKVEVYCLVEYNIITHSKKMADLMFDEAEKSFKGSDAEVRFDDYGEFKNIIISCWDTNDFEFEDEYDEPIKHMAEKIEEFRQDVRNDNIEYVKQIQDMDENSESDFDND